VNSSICSHPTTALMSSRANDQEKGQDRCNTVCHSMNGPISGSQTTKAKAADHKQYKPV
jgi:hypothetical protein